jgi:hypothetical protein
METGTASEYPEDPLPEKRLSRFQKGEYLYQSDSAGFPEIPVCTSG